MRFPGNLTQWRARVPGAERLARWSNVLLVVALAYSMAQVTWTVLPAPPAASVPRVRTTGPAVDGGAQTGDLASVAALHLFGTAEPQQAETEPSVMDAPETRLNLKLHGVAAASDPEKAFAIIARGNGAERTYKVGAELPGGAVLREIHYDRVILERSGRFETLTLPKERVGTVASAAPQAAGSTRSGVGRQIQALRREILSNPQDAMKLVQVQPVMAGGTLQGYRVRPRAKKDLFRRAGLRPGDVVTTVNGVALNDPTRIGDVIKQLSTADSLTVTVDRGGREETVVVPLR